MVICFIFFKSKIQKSLFGVKNLVFNFVQAHARAVETARSTSKVTVDFFKTLDLHASNLTQIVEEAQTVNNKKLSELEEKFEVVAVYFLH